MSDPWSTTVVKGFASPLTPRLVLHPLTPPFIVTTTKPPEVRSLPNSPVELPEATPLALTSSDVAAPHSVPVSLPRDTAAISLPPPHLPVSLPRDIAVMALPVSLQQSPQIQVSLPRATAPVIAPLPVSLPMLRSFWRPVTSEPVEQSSPPHITADLPFAGSSERDIGLPELDDDAMLSGTSTGRLKSSAPMDVSPTGVKENNETATPSLASEDATLKTSSSRSNDTYKMPPALLDLIGVYMSAFTG